LIATLDDSVPTSSTSPNRTAKNGCVLAGADEKMMDDPLTVYAVSGSCTTPPKLTIKLAAAPGITATDDSVNENVVQALLNDAVRSSRCAKRPTDG